MHSLLKLDEESYKRLIQIRENPNSAIELLNENDYAYLLDKKILVSDQEDEAYIDMLKYKQRKASFSSETLGIVICPTLSCNFACPYCYEHNLPNRIMKEAVQEQFIDFINKYEQKCKSMTLTWHGGEPLLAFPVIKQIYEKLETKSRLPLSYSTMVSNGYLLNEEICTFFANKKLNYLQITIDGNKQTHNKTRVLKNGNSSFERIMENIDMATELMPNCRIGIRTNIGKANQEEYIALYEELSNRWKGKNCNIYYAFVLDNSLHTDNENRQAFELTTDEKCNFKVSLVHNGIISKESLYPHLCCTSKTCTSDNAFVIDPEGNLYKCWADVGIKERAIGDLTDGIKNYGIVSQFVVGTDKFADNKCKQCHYLPVCDGGCNLYRVGYIEKGIPYNVCSFNDESLIKYIETYMETQSIKQI